MGELALLLEGTRTASVRARCDAELLELGRDGFEALIQEAPSFALGLTRALGAQLAATRMPVIAPMLPQAIAVVALDAGAPSAEVAEWLADALGVHGSVARLSAGELAGIPATHREAHEVRNVEGSCLRHDGPNRAGIAQQFCSTPWDQLDRDSH